MTESNFDVLSFTIKVDRNLLDDAEYVEGVVHALVDQARRKLRGDLADDETASIEDAVRRASEQPGRVFTARP